jgi:phosphate starvation-inducible protein PhoH and related proteins
LIGQKPFAIRSVIPLGVNQERAFDAYEQGKNLFLHGYAGTGKTFLSMYLALKDIQESGYYHSLYIVRSAVPSRDMGFLPGNIKEKAQVYEAPYHGVGTELYGRGDAYEVLKKKGMIEFFSTSYIRGLTLRDCILFVDEVQNLSDHEINSIITRVGDNCRVIFSGDFRQSDLTNSHDKKGIHNFLQIAKMMPSFELIEFGVDDICRSGIVKEYILSREKLGL